jgi:hypothetical protein
VQATAKELAVRLYGDTVPWVEFPATCTTCFSYTEFERT